MAKSSTRRVAIYINGKEVETSNPRITNRWGTVIPAMPEPPPTFVLLFK